MKLLILTQKIDRNDDVLGFFHGWVEMFAKNFDSLKVICLEQGQTSLPANVEVFSLGKEKKRSKTMYVRNFYKYIWQERKNYDTVFVHMNKEYVILGGIFWRLWGKKVILWYNHPKGTVSARFAGLLAHKILYTSSYSFFNRNPKARQMPVGINTEVFKKEVGVVSENSVLSLGRIAPVKNLDILIDAALVLEEKGRFIPVHIYGSALPRDKDYAEDMKLLAQPLFKKNLVVFHGPVSNKHTPEIYQKYTLSANLTPTGSFDKTIIEAMACECIVLASNQSFRDLLSPEFQKMLVFEERNAYDLADKIEELIGLPQDDRNRIGQELREIVLRDHSLEKLTEQLVALCKN